MSGWLTSAFGYGGAGLILLGYFQVSRGAWKGKGLPFQLTNLCGAVLLLVYALVLTAYANVLLNAVWLVVAVVTITHLILRRKS